LLSMFNTLCKNSSEEVKLKEIMGNYLIFLITCSKGEPYTYRMVDLM
jgi:hypothetical protein